MHSIPADALTIGLEHLGMDDVPRVGGKNASLGELIQHLGSAGVSVPGGFATTAHAFRQFLSRSGLDETIRRMLHGLDVDDVNELKRTGERIRTAIASAPLTAELEQALREGYAAMGGAEPAVAVRSSATAEDLPEASFAGQQETFLNVRGIDNVLGAVHEVFASLFNDRAISYRVHHGFDHMDVALSAGIQRMVRSDLSASGVVFTIDTESGFRDVVLITAAYGLGEAVVQGAVNPDEFYVHKPTLAANRPSVLSRNLGSKALKMIYGESSGEPVVTVEVPTTEREVFCLSDEDVEALARMAVAIEKHYGRPMDIEWGKDGETGEICILQARPETVESRASQQVLERYSMDHKGNQTEGQKADRPGEVLVTGRSIGQRIGSGPVRIVTGLDQLASVEPGDVLVTDMTDPDWEPVMKRAAAIVTNRGGRTCHAAIIARELGVPAVVGCGDATKKLAEAGDVTVSCAEGDTGFVYADALEFSIQRIDLESMPDLPFKIAMNVGNPERAFTFRGIPNHGIGLARLEFIISTMIGIHPRALLEFDSQSPEVKSLIRKRTVAYGGPIDFYIKKLVEGISTLGAAFAPNPVIVRLSDFKSNEYAHLIGGEQYEPDEENPMLGFRGAARYLDASFRQCFELECRALKEVREVMGLDNVWAMVPFVRTLDEAEQVVALLEENGLKRGEHGLKLMMMCEIPSNALLADQFLEYFDGFSIGSNDLTQLTLGLDRDSALIAERFDERDPAVRVLLARAIEACKLAGKYVGICGQGPSDHPDLARWLMEQGIDSVSLNPDTVVDTWLYLAGQETD